MTSPADLERITDKLEQAEAILANSEGPARRLAAVRHLLTACRSEDMPTSGTRALWVEIAVTMIRLGGGPASAQDMHALGRQIHELRARSWSTSHASHTEPATCAILAGSARRRLPGVGGRLACSIRRAGPPITVR